MPFFLNISKKKEKRKTNTPEDTCTDGLFCLFRCSTNASCQQSEWIESQGLSPAMETCPRIITIEPNVIDAMSDPVKVTIV